jgi:hypothetical protein
MRIRLLRHVFENQKHLPAIEPRATAREKHRSWCVAALGKPLRQNLALLFLYGDVLL